MGRKAFDEHRHFWPKIEKKESCWIWRGYKVTGGYGQISVNGKRFLIHRWIYEKLKGKIPLHMTIDHICNNPSCVNPDHLQVLSQLDNNLRSPSFGANKIYCKNGHEFTEENTYQRPNKKGFKQWRECRKCIYLRTKKYRKRKNT